MGEMPVWLVSSSYLVPVCSGVSGLGGGDGGVEGGRQLPPQAVLHVRVEAQREQDRRQLGRDSIRMYQLMISKDD